MHQVGNTAHDTENYSVLVYHIRTVHAATSQHTAETRPRDRQDELREFPSLCLG